MLQKQLLVSCRLATMQQKWTPRSCRYTTTVHAGSQKRKQKPTPFSGWHPLLLALGPPCRARLPMGQRNLLLLLLRPSHSLLRPVFLPAPVSPSPPPDCCPLQQFSPGRPVFGPLLPCHLHRSFDRQRRSRCIVHQGESLADHEGGTRGGGEKSGRAAFCSSSSRSKSWVLR